MGWKTWLIQSLLGIAGILLQTALKGFYEKDTVNDLFKFARITVEGLMDKDMDNEAKRKAASDEIKKDLKEVGKEVKDSLINLAIELSVSAVKNG